ncbi:MAG: hypothetical protein Q4C03_06635 [bacterium]|nr:hypothetical protein [bacterium]
MFQSPPARRILEELQMLESLINSADFDKIRAQFKLSKRLILDQTGQIDNAAVDAYKRVDALLLELEEAETKLAAIAALYN